MRSRAVPCLSLLVLAPLQAQQASHVDPARPQGTLSGVRIEGGDEDDRRYAAAALGLRVGQPVDAAGFEQALAAVRLVDRFASVTGSLDAQGLATVRLDPLPPLEGWSLAGDAVPRDLAKGLFPTLRTGQRLGPLRLGGLADEAVARLREGGFPEARLEPQWDPPRRHLRWVATLGAPALVRSIRMQGDFGPFAEEKLLRVSGLQPGTTRWTPTALREAQRRLRQFLVKEKHLESQVRLSPVPDQAGMLAVDIQAGPEVTLEAAGLSGFKVLLGQPRLSDFVPLARAERYSPSLLDEGAGRITAYFRDQGHPEARTTCTRTVTAGPADKPQKVTLTFRVDPGPRRALGRVTLEGNRELSDADLREAITLPRRVLWGRPAARAEAIKALEDRVTAAYLQRGFADVRVRRRVETAADGAVDVRLIVREGRRRFLESLLLDLPDDPALAQAGLERSLLLAISDRPAAGEGGAYRSDRRHLQGLEARLVRDARGARLAFKPALPLVRSDLALVLSDLKQRLGSLGAANPQVSVAFEDEEAEPRVRLQVPAQPLDRARRLVVQGSDRTRAEAVLRETPAPQGGPLDPAALDAGQVRLGGLGAFQRVDLLTLKDLPGQAAQPWQRGDLTLKLQERSPWVFGESFGYDKSQGYHFGASAQRLNVGGMGRTLDFSARAGDLTLDNPFLRRAFPTGPDKRSVDSYAIAYTDPWFQPGALKGLLADRTRFQMEGAYIEEAQAAFFARRRRFSPSLEWKLGPVQAVRLGYRFERVEVAANTDADGRPLISDQDLFLTARTPPKSIISAPYLQVSVDRRDRAYDPTEGTFFLGRLELANQFFGTSANSSFVKLDLRHQWNWPLGFRGESGVLMANARLGLARPTAQSAEDLPLSERFFGGGPFTVRGVEPDMLGPLGQVTTQTGALKTIPLGGQAIAVVNLELRFPLFGWQSVWGEVFADAGQVYRTLHPAADAGSPFPPLRTTLGAGLILKLGFPLKLEYAADWKRIMGRPRTQEERDTQLRSLLISAGFQF